MSVQHQQLPAYGFDQAPFAWGEPSLSADFKTEPRDFVVEEVLGFEPSGAGEHLFLLLQTDDHNTRYTVKCLARLFGVRQRQVSYSGLKDRRGLTSQWFSIHLPGTNPEPDREQLAAEGIGLLRHARHHRKLRIGTHKANRFHIVLRNVTAGDDGADSDGEESLKSRLQSIQQHGVPNYFGGQRFGHHGGNVAEALEWVERGELPAERPVRSRVLSTLRSWWFNGTLGQRIAVGNWRRWLPADPILLDGSQSFFTEETWDEPLQQRYDTGDIHIGAWLPGAATEGLPEGIARLLSLADMKPEPRPLRLLPRNLTVDRSENQLSLQFELPKGAFATAVLRELVNLHDLSSGQVK